MHAEYTPNVSIVECFRNSKFVSMLISVDRHTGIFTNEKEILKGSSLLKLPDKPGKVWISKVSLQRKKANKAI